ncbi:hypothetical protein FB451DRAFT_1408639 [Mycena latifolia]|nr:hypothetical protein FB451DRAFT_1408639 [Mycena latifolia]
MSFLADVFWIVKFHTRDLSLCVLLASSRRHSCVPAAPVSPVAGTPTRAEPVPFLSLVVLISVTPVGGFVLANHPHFRSRPCPPSAIRRLAPYALRLLPGAGARPHNRADKFTSRIGIGKFSSCIAAAPSCRRLRASAGTKRPFVVRTPLCSSVKDVSCAMKDGYRDNAQTPVVPPSLHALGSSKIVGAPMLRWHPTPLWCLRRRKFLLSQLVRSEIVAHPGPRACRPVRTVLKLAARSAPSASESTLLLDKISFTSSPAGTEEEAQTTAQHSISFSRRRACLYACARLFFDSELYLSSDLLPSHWQSDRPTSSGHSSFFFE